MRDLKFQNFSYEKVAFTFLGTKAFPGLAGVCGSVCQQFYFSNKTCLTLQKLTSYSSYDQLWLDMARHEQLRPVLTTHDHLGSHLVPESVSDKKNWNFKISQDCHRNQIHRSCMVQWQVESENLIVTSWEWQVERDKVKSGVLRVTRQ